MPADGDGEINVKGSVIEWSMKDFLSQFQNSYYRSPEFFFCNESWFFDISPYGSEVNGSRGYIDVGLTKASYDPPIRKEFIVGIKTADGMLALERHLTHTFVPWNDKTVTQWISRSELLERKSDLLPSGTLTIVCKHPESDKISSKEVSSEYSTLFRENKVLRDLKELFLKQTNCDVIIRVKERKFPAHRIILSARSSVFDSMFRSDMKEKKTGTVDVEDCEPSSFSEFLCFLYCGDTSIITMENVFSLFTASDKYQVVDLREKCIEFMKKNLSVDAFCDVMTLALLHSETELIATTTYFFTKNVFEIANTAKWQSFSAENPAQSNKLFLKALEEAEKENQRFIPSDPTEE